MEFGTANCNPFVRYPKKELSAAAAGKFLL